MHEPWGADMNRTIDRALWRAVGERVADEKAHRAVIRDLIEQGARPDAVFGMHAFSDRDAPYLSKVTALERLLLCAHPSSWPGRLELLFQAGMDPNPFLEGFQEILASHRHHSAQKNASQYNCVARMSPVDGLDIHWLGFLTHFYVQHFYVYAPDEAMALLDVALKAGADPDQTPFLCRLWPNWPRHRSSSRVPF